MSDKVESPVDETTKLVEDESLENKIETLQEIASQEVEVSMLSAEDKIENLQEVAEKETQELVKDVEDLNKEVQEHIDNATKEIEAEVNEAHEDAKDEIEDIKEEITDKVEEHSRLIASLLYLCGCVRSFMKKREKTDEKEALITPDGLDHTHSQSIKA